MPKALWKADVSAALLQGDGRSLPPTPPLSFWQVVPDLVIEVVSPNDRWTVVQQKIEADLNAGVREVWIVDPRARRLTIRTAAAAPRVLAADDVLDAGSIVESFTMRVRDLFSGIDSFAPLGDVIRSWTRSVDVARR